MKKKKGQGVFFFFFFFFWRAHRRTPEHWAGSDKEQLLWTKERERGAGDGAQCAGGLIRDEPLFTSVKFSDEP